MNWNDPQIIRAYKTGWQSGFRRARYLELIRPGASEDARQVMLNEFERSIREDTKRVHKLAQPKKTNKGNDAWKALAG
jgi:hypothetical protein